METITAASCFEKFAELPIIDVRSPGEFEKGHIPGAFNIPLFENEERARVGATYTQNSREKAIEIGLEIVRPKLQWFIDESRKAAPRGEVAVHCWRGGMRSAAFARHLSDHGFPSVKIVEGGYKAFRNHVLDFYRRPFRIKVLGGYTGSGKTEILKCLRASGAQTIDLEGLANHRGSAFGGIGLPNQPTTQQFENDLFRELLRIEPADPLWIEDESQRIGSIYVPGDFFDQMKRQTVYFVDISRRERAKHLVETYSGLNPENLADSIRRIAKRMGFDRAKEALEALEKGDHQRVVEICLTYYDKHYLRDLGKRDPEKVVRIPLESADHRENAKRILALAGSDK